MTRETQGWLRQKLPLLSGCLSEDFFRLQDYRHSKREKNNLTEELCNKMRIYSFRLARYNDYLIFSEQDAAG